MPLITDITEQKQKGRVNLYIDNEFACGMFLETCIKLGLTKGREIDAKEVIAAIEEDDARRAMNKALDLLKYRARSQSELINALIGKGYSKAAADRTIIRLKELNYINDFEFAKMYAEDAKLKNMSKRQLSFKLRQKGVGREETEYALSLMDDESQMDAVRIEAQKYYVKTKGAGRERRGKTAQALMRKGFEWDIIKSVLDEVVDYEED